MSIAATIAAIKALPDMQATCTDGEYRVTFSVIAIREANIAAKVSTSFGFVQARQEAVACYTNDAQDAIDTARALQARGYRA